MRTVDEFLENTLLEHDADQLFRQSATRVAARHQGWRANFPTIAVLLDSADERARALAGNYATEARETIGAWLQAHDVAAASTGDPARKDELAGWVEGYGEAWRRQVMSGADVAQIDDGPRAHFTAMFDELMERSRDEAVAHIRNAGRTTGQGRRLVASVLRPFGAVGRALAAFFFPGRRH